MTHRLRIFIGTYTSGDDEGIFYGDVDPATGAITLRGNAGGIQSPSYLSLDSAGRHLYAVCEISDEAGHGAVRAYAVDPDSGALTALNEQSTGGAGPCHTTVDGSDRYLLSANYGGGSCCIHPILEDGSLGELSDFKQHTGASVNPNRQQGPHAHSINVDPSNRFALCADLGIDQVVVYGIDHAAGKLEEKGAGTVTPGEGPRHFAFHPDGRFGYVINEIGNTITAYTWDGDGGRLDEIQTIATIPGDYTDTTHTADIHLSPDGAFLYGSNRGHDTIAIFRVDAGDGTLAPIGYTRVPSNPRNFALDPEGRFLFAAGQDANEIVTFRRDAGTGLLEPTGHGIQIPKPVCVKLITLD